MTDTNAIGDEHIGGTIKITLTGVITGVIEHADYVEINVDPGLPGGTLAQIRCAKADPLDVASLVAGEPQLDPAPPPPPDGVNPALDADAVEPTPEAGE